MIFLFVICNITASAKQPVKKILLGNGDSLAMTKENVEKIVKDSTWDLTLLKPFFECYEYKQKNTTEGAFFYNLLRTFTDYHKVLFYKAKRNRDYDMFMNIKKRSTVLSTYIINNREIVNGEWRSLMRMPRNCEKEMSIILGAKIEENTPLQNEEINHGVDYNLIIKEQREQIEYLKKRLEECEEKNKGQISE